MKYIFLLILLLPLAGTAQVINPRQVASLPDAIKESSGLITVDANKFWSHNDGGDHPNIYCIDSTGKLIRTLHISNASNKDWEDIAEDDDGNLYIGEFGNNDNKRMYLRIYIIPNPVTLSSDTTIADIIEYSYPDQNDYPPPAPAKNFDVEAMVWLNDSIHLFTKNYSVPNTGYTKRYVLPVKEGMQTPVLRDSFFTDANTMSGQVTAASLSNDNKMLVLLSYSRIYVFKGFSGSNFFSGEMLSFDIAMTQKEGIDFLDNCRVYITDEELFGFGRKLYTLDVCSLIPTGVPQPAAEISDLLSSPQPNPMTGISRIYYRLPRNAESGRIIFVNSKGQISKEVKVNDKTSNPFIEIQRQDFTSGTYIYSFISATGDTLATGRKLLVK
ncbi:MAG: hypothetical protein WD077_08090 [Bacteroidia bacterium]